MNGDHQPDCRTVTMAAPRTFAEHHECMNPLIHTYKCTYECFYASVYEEPLHTCVVHVCTYLFIYMHVCYVQRLLTFVCINRNNINMYRRGSQENVHRFPHSPSSNSHILHSPIPFRIECGLAPLRKLRTDAR